MILTASASVWVRRDFRKWPCDATKIRREMAASRKNPFRRSLAVHLFPFSVSVEPPYLEAKYFQKTERATVVLLHHVCATPVVLLLPFPHRDPIHTNTPQATHVSPHEDVLVPR